MIFSIRRKVGVPMSDAIGIILSGGIGTRMNSDIPKQYLDLLGQKVIQYSIDAFRKADSLNDFVVVADSEKSIKFIEENYRVKAILGGNTRNESFYAALNFIDEHYDCEWIFVNEAARPMITPHIIEEYMELIKTCDCVYCVKDITDSLEMKTGCYVDRTEYELVMSPEAYRFEMIKKYFDPHSKTTFPGHVLPDTSRKIKYTDYRNNLKLTYPEDLILLKTMLKIRKSK